MQYSYVHPFTLLLSKLPSYCIKHILSHLHEKGFGKAL